MDESDTIRLNIRITKDFNAKLEDWCKRLALNKSQLSAMALRAGLNNIIRAISPEDVLTPDMLKLIIEASKEGLDDLETNRRPGAK